MLVQHVIVVDFNRFQYTSISLCNLRGRFKVVTDCYLYFKLPLLDGEWAAIHGDIIIQLFYPLPQNHRLPLLPAFPKTLWQTPS
jgi:hypothetical protein